MWTRPLASLDTSIASNVLSLLPTSVTPIDKEQIDGLNRVIPTSVCPKSPAYLLAHVNGWALSLPGASQVAQMVNSLPAMWEIQV